MDLGRTHAQACSKVLLRLVRPAIGSDAGLASLASVENYNTTTFTFGEYPTLTIELAQKVRYGITPAISALAFIIVVLTVFAALANEAAIRRKVLVAAARKSASVEELASGKIRLPGFLSSNAAAVVLVVVAMMTIAVVGTAAVYSPAQCIADVREQKRLETDLRIQELRQRRADEAARKAAEQGDQEPATETAPKPSNNSGFGGVFDPGALQDGGTQEPEPEEPGNNSGFGGVFDPNALQNN